ncbi:MAG: hypothetical protein NT045_08600 [Candidatus Aureabacteria bacterium]|nr:hypothetical protein [Candidatus Auribacterota bacterium]
MMKADQFDRIIGEYVVPIAELTDGAGDAFYFLRKNGSFVFTQGYAHPAGGIYCKIIYFPERGGWVNIHGREYNTTIKRVVNGALELVPHDEQLRRHYEIDPTLDPKEKIPCWAEYHVRLPLSDFIGYFDHRKSLRRAMVMYPQVAEAVNRASEILEVPIGQLGCTGSLSYGRLEEPADDIDLCIYGTLAENKKVIERIYRLTREPARRVVEFSKFWPMRFYHGPLMICPFFEYLDPDEIPLKELETEILRENVKATGRVKDDTHGIYMPVVLTLERVTIGGEPHADLPLIIYDGSLRGEFAKGDSVILNRARLVRVRERGKTFTALMVTLSPQISKDVPARPDAR